MTERQKYLHLLALVIEDLPTSAIDDALRAGYPASAALLNNVRIGRVHSLPHLLALVGFGLPKYEVPADLRPVPTSAPLGA